jgi:hypothetical protein
MSNPISIILINITLVCNADCRGALEENALDDDFL